MAKKAKPRVKKPRPAEVGGSPPSQDHLWDLRNGEDGPAAPAAEAPQPPVEDFPKAGVLAGIAAPPSTRNAFGRYCRVMVEIEQDDEDGVRTVIKSSPWTMDGPRAAVRFIRRHTGYDPFA